jgi:hypothetical protein
VATPLLLHCIRARDDPGEVKFNRICVMYPCVGFSDVVAMCRIMRLCIIEFIARCDTFELHLLEFENTLVDWNTLQIDDKVDDEGRFEVVVQEEPMTPIKYVKGVVLKKLTPKKKMV